MAQGCRLSPIILHRTNIYSVTIITACHLVHDCAIFNRKQSELILIRMDSTNNFCKSKNVWNVLRLENEKKSNLFIFQYKV